MIPENISNLLSKQPGMVDRDLHDNEKVHQCLNELGLLGHEQWNDFFLKYKLSGVLTNRSTELLDIASPSPQIAEVTDFVRDVYDVTEDYVCLTSGEGEGFYLYSIVDRKIYDVTVDELDELESGGKEARWDSFYDLIEWYLS